MKYASTLGLLAIVFAVSSINAQAAQMALWTFNEGSGTTAYDSIGEFDGTLQGSAAWGVDRFGNPGSAVITGNNAWVNIPDTLKSPVGTFAAWVYVTGYDSSAAPIFSSEQGSGASNFSYRLQVTSAGHLRMESIAPYSSTGSRSATSSQALELDTWYHVAGTYDGNTVACYINGSLADSNYYGTYQEMNTSENIRTAIGHLEGWSVQWFRGSIDDAAAFNTALDSNQIAALVPEPGVVTLMVIGGVITGLSRHRRPC